MTTDTDTGTARRASRLRHFDARAARTRSTRSYSSFVGFMRYALPAAAILILSVVLAWPLMTGREDGFRITFSESSTIDGTLRMVKARYLGTDSKNQPYTITADEAIQEDSESPLIQLHRITADIFVNGGQAEWYAVTANEGLYRRDTELLDLIGAVTLFSDAGHEFHTEQAQIDLGAGIASGNRPVAGQGPLGLLNAGNFRLVDSGETLYFGDRVRLVIFPNARENDEG